MKSREELHQELRRRILSLSDVTERHNAGIHEDAFFVGGSYTSMATAIATFNWRKTTKSGFLRKAKHASTAGRLKRDT